MSTSAGTNGTTVVAETNGNAAPQDTIGEGVDLHKGVEGGPPINTTAGGTQPPRPQPPGISYLAPQDNYFYQDAGEDTWYKGSKTLVKGKLRKAGIADVELYLEEIRKAKSIERVEYQGDKPGIVEVDGKKVLFQKPLGLAGLGLPRMEPNWEDKFIYESETGRNWTQNEKGEWTRVSDKVLEIGLRKLGLSHRIPDGKVSSPLEDAIERYQKNLKADYVGKLAGHSPGIYRQNGARILVTVGPTLIIPAPAPFPTIDRLLNEIFGDQRARFDGWLKESFGAITTMTKRQSVVLIMAGDPDCGKSFVQEFIITPVLGNRRVDPYKFMSGQTSFNRELNEAEHLMIEDAAAKKDINSRQVFGDYLKQIAANNSTHHHAKGKDGCTLEPIRRMSISVNKERNLDMLPPIESDLKDKILMLEAKRAEDSILPKSIEERDAFKAKVLAELPGYLQYLENWEIPAEVKGSRFGVAAWQNPEILQQIEGTALHNRYLELIDKFYEGRTESWRGSALDLELELMDPPSLVRDEVRKLLKGPKTGSKYLTELAKNKPERVKPYRGHGGKHKFEISFVVEGKPVTEKPITVQTEDGTLVEGEAIAFQDIATVKTTNGKTVSGKVWNGTRYHQTAELKPGILAGKK